MRRKRRINAGMATTTTQAPSVNLDTRKTIVATAVITAPMPLMAARHVPVRWAQASPVHHETGLREGEAGEDPDGEQRDQRVRVAAHGEEEHARHHGECPDAERVRLPVAPQGEEVRYVVVAGEEAGEDRETTERGVGGQREHDGDGHRHDVVGPSSPDGERHDLAQDGLPRAGADVPALGQNGESEQHGAEDDAEQQLGRLGAPRPRFAEQRDSVGDGLDAGQRAASGRESLEDEQERDRLEPGGRQLGGSRQGLPETERVNEADGDDGQQSDDEHHRRQQEGPGGLAEAAEVEDRDDEQDAEAQRHGRPGE